MGITPTDFQILAYVLYGGAAKLKTLTDKYGKAEVKKLVDDGYLVRFAADRMSKGGGYVSLSKMGKKTVTLGVAQ